MFASTCKTALWNETRFAQTSANRHARPKFPSSPAVQKDFAVPHTNQFHTGIRQKSTQLSDATVATARCGGGGGEELREEWNDGVLQANDRGRKNDMSDWAWR